MKSIDQILWLAAAVLFALEAFGLGRRIKLGWLGFALIALTFVV